MNITRNNYYNKIKTTIEKCILFGPKIVVLNAIINRCCTILSPSLIENLSKLKYESIKRNLIPFVDEILVGIRNYDTSSKIIPREELPIWVCWLQGESNMPEIVKTCYSSILNHAGLHKVKLITLENLREYVIIDEVIWEKYKNGKINNGHFADIIRLNLLENYGGLWLDATMLCIAPVEELITDVNFYTIKMFKRDPRFSHFHWTVGCLGSCEVGNRLIHFVRVLLEEYIKRYDILIDYLLLDNIIRILYQKDDQIKRTIDAVPYTNDDMYMMIGILTEKFDKNRWVRLTSYTHFFILNWKKYSESELTRVSIDTYYYKIKKIVFGDN